MELFRVTRNPWGQETLVGVSWDLLWWFVGAGVAIIVLHALWSLVKPARLRRNPDEGGGAT